MPRTRDLLTALSLLIGSSAAFANNITVTTTSDVSANDGICTLREAINSANTNTAVGGCTAGAVGADTISFAIPGSGTQTIQPTSMLPSIIEALTINGYTQPGSAVNTSASGDNAVLEIVVNGFNCPLVGGGSYSCGAVLVMPAPMANNAQASGNTVGGSNPADRNVISGAGPTSSSTLVVSGAAVG